MLNDEDDVRLMKDNLMPLLGQVAIPNSYRFPENIIQQAKFYSLDKPFW